jgi:hypothetical protein
MLTDLEILQDILDFHITLNPLLLGLLGDPQRAGERVMDVVGVKGCSDLVNITVNETLGPCHDGLGLGTLFGSWGHGSDGKRAKGENSKLESSCLIYDQGLPRRSR